MVPSTCGGDCRARGCLCLSGLTNLWSTVMAGRGARRAGPCSPVSLFFQGGVRGPEPFSHCASQAKLSGMQGARSAPAQGGCLGPRVGMSDRCVVDPKGMLVFLC